MTANSSLRVCVCVCVCTVGRTAGLVNEFAAVVRVHDDADDVFVCFNDCEYNGWLHGRSDVAQVLWLQSCLFIVIVVWLCVQSQTCRMTVVQSPLSLCCHCGAVGIADGADGPLVSADTICATFLSLSLSLCLAVCYLSSCNSNAVGSKT